MDWQPRPYTGQELDSDEERDLLQVSIEEYDTQTYLYEPVIDRDDVQLRDPYFTIPQDQDATAQVLSELYYPDELLDSIVQSSNEYARDHFAASKYQPITRSELLRFFACVTYMGVVKLPAKEDYFPPADDDWWPRHPAIHLKKTRFLYIWRTFHPSYRSANGDGEEEEVEIDMDDVDVNNNIVDNIDGSIGAAVSNLQETERHTQSRYEEDNDEYNEADDEEEHKWYTAVKGFVKHINNISKKLMRTPGIILSLDEMLRLFKGRSAQTERMQRKPDKQGFKLFAICDLVTAFVYDFFPTGRLEKTTIEENVERLMSTLPNPETNDYVVCMDNYFTRPKTMKLANRLGIGAFGTARRQRGWTPMDDVDDWEFNTVYLEHDKNNYLVTWWIDNAEVLMVSNIHSGYSVVDSHRKRPRETAANRDHVRRLFGTEGEKTMEIPEIINDYNHWMNGVDLADQLISAFKLKFRCMRTWVPLFLQSMDIARTNSYVLHKFKKGTQAMTHKQFVRSWIEALNNRATSDEYSHPITRSTSQAKPKARVNKRKRDRAGHKSPETGLGAKRLEASIADHINTPTDQQRTCRYCAYLAAKAKKEGHEPPKISRPKHKCAYCDVNLCKAPCHALYHCQEVSEV